MPAPAIHRQQEKAEEQQHWPAHQQLPAGQRRTGVVRRFVAHLVVEDAALPQDGRHQRNADGADQHDARPPAERQHQLPPSPAVAAAKPRLPLKVWRANDRPIRLLSTEPEMIA